MHKTPKPTQEQFTAYRAMFNYFNRRLFSGELPEIVLNFSRRAKSAGFFAPVRWEQAEGEGKTHEISLNPDTLTREANEVASTLVHEMCHLWQHELGTPPRKGYHDREWASKMESVGLQPSHTGEVGGRRVGPSMTHYVIDGGRFDLAFREMPETCVLPWRSEAHGPKGKPVKRVDTSKVKHTCPRCGVNAWGKLGIKLVCGDCHKSLKAA